MNDTDSRRFTIEYRDTGKTAVVDAQSLKVWHTDEIPMFRKLELEALNAERELLGARERITIPGPQVAPAPQQIQEITTPTETAAQREEVTEPEQPEVEHREPAQEQRAPARVPRAPAPGTGLMDRQNFSNYHKDNIIGDINAGRSTRNRPAALAAHKGLKKMSPFEMLGKGLWEIVRMARTLDGMADRENEPYKADHDNGDNEDSLERDLTQSNWRQDKLSASRQTPNEVGR